MHAQTHCGWADPEGFHEPSTHLSPEKSSTLERAPSGALHGRHAQNKLGGGAAC